MTERNPGDEPDDPRGTVGPPDPYGERGSVRGGGSVEDHPGNGRYPDSRGRGTRHICHGCEQEIPLHMDYCLVCQRRGSSPDDSADEPVERRCIDRAVLAVVEADGEWTAASLGKAALSQAADTDGTRSSERVRLATEFDDGLPEPLDRRVDYLPDAVALDAELAATLLDTVDTGRAQTLYDSSGTPIDAETSVSAVRDALGPPERGRYWLVPGVVERVTRTGIDDCPTDGGGHTDADSTGERKRVMENPCGVTGRDLFDE